MKPVLFLPLISSCLITCKEVPGSPVLFVFFKVDLEDSCGNFFYSNGMRICVGMGLVVSCFCFFLKKKVDVVVVNSATIDVRV